MSILHPVCDYCNRPVRPDTQEPHEWVHVEDSFYSCVTNYPQSEFVATVDGATLCPEPRLIRRAVVRSKSSSLETIQRYLPANYEAEIVDDEILIVGVDNAGWTLDDYVIPRLASGLHTAEEVHWT